MFESLVGLLDQIDPAKLNAVLRRAVRGFPRPGRTHRAGHHRRESSAARDSTRAARPFARTSAPSTGFSDAYGAAAQDIITVLDAASTTSDTVTRHAAALDTLLLNTIGLAHAGTDLIGTEPAESDRRGEHSRAHHQPAVEI